ncbi:MAG: helix-turn-helix transcriptional regulator [Akkermansiaceae bacterium]|nr:helix-turn-helix transcriptional regulator [Akkermansiaceae bacterium]
MKIDVNHLKIRVYAFDMVNVGDWWNFKNHISPFARIFLIRQGEQIVSFGGTDYRHRANSLALVPPFTPVSYHCRDACLQDYFVFSCRLPNGKDLFTDYKFPYHLEAEKWHYALCDQLIQVLPNFGLQNVNADSDNFNQLIFETKSKDATLHQKFAAQGVVSLLMSSFAVGAEISHQLIRFARAFQYIENNLARDLSLSALSEIEGMSRTYFSDQFHHHTGVRPSEYIAQKRENKARELLTTTNLRLPEIAEKVGFPDTAYFMRFFKKRTGVTPTAYRLR